MISSGQIRKKDFWINIRKMNLDIGRIRGPTNYCANGYLYSRCCYCCISHQIM